MVGGEGELTTLADIFPLRCALFCDPFAPVKVGQSVFTVSHWKLTMSSRHPPFPEQRPSPAGGSPPGRCGCVPCRSGAGPVMPPCPGKPFAFPPPEATPAL